MFGVSWGIDPVEVMCAEGSYTGGVVAKVKAESSRWRAVPRRSREVQGRSRRDEVLPRCLEDAAVGQILDGL